MPWLCAAAALTGVVAVMFGDANLPFPNLGSGRAGVPILVMLPLLVTSVMIAGLTAGPAATERTAARPIAAYDTVLLIAIVGLVVAAGLALTMTGMQTRGAAGARNLVGYLGIALLIHRYRGAAPASAAAAGFAMIVGLFGHRPTGQPWFWAWPLEESGSAPAAIIAATLFTVWILGHLLPTRIRSMAG